MRRMLWFKLYNMISTIDKSGAAKISRGRERDRKSKKRRGKKPVESQACHIGIQLAVFLYEPPHNLSSPRLTHAWLSELCHESSTSPGLNCDNTGAVLSSFPYHLKMKIWLSSSSFFLLTLHQPFTSPHLIPGPLIRSSSTGISARCYMK